MSDPSSPDNSFYFQNIMKESIDRVEVLKGIKVHFMVLMRLAVQFTFLQKKENPGLDKILLFNQDQMIQIVFITQQMEEMIN